MAVGETLESTVFSTEDLGSLEPLAAESSSDLVGKFAVLYSVFQPQLFKNISRRMGGTVEAEDITQQAFTNAFANFSRFKGGPNDFKAWMGKISSNLLTDWWRNKGKLCTSSLDMLMESGTEIGAPRVLTTASDTGNAIQEFLCSLSEDHAELVRLRHIDGLTINEIANLRKVDVESIHYKLGQAVRTLKKLAKSGYKPGTNLDMPQFLQIPGNRQSLWLHGAHMPDQDAVHLRELVVKYRTDPDTAHMTNKEIASAIATAYGETLTARELHLLKKRIDNANDKLVAQSRVPRRWHRAGTQYITQA